MSLTISVHEIDKSSGEISADIVLPEGADLAGFERWRENLYGSTRAVSLGLILLPTLRLRDIQVAGPDLIKLKKEAECIAEHAALFAPDTGCEEGTIRARAQNIGHACDLAAAHGGMVWIS